MLVLLPPSETKRAGGDPERPLDLDALSRPGLSRPRRAALARVAELSRNARSAARALGLGERNGHEALLNRELRRGPTMPAVDRFDGVLYDVLDVATLDATGRAWLQDHVSIASALFGLVAAEDRIPSYRLSASTPLPGATLRSIWRDALVRELERDPGPTLDLRSEAYVALGPAPGSTFVRVVTDEGGRRRALNHFNKAAKGRLVRLLAAGRPDVADSGELVDWLRAQGARVAPGAPGELDLVVDG